MITVSELAEICVEYATDYSCNTKSSTRYKSDHNPLLDHLSKIALTFVHYLCVSFKTYFTSVLLL